MPAKKGSTDQKKKTEWYQDDRVYEAERIIDHVTFEYAYKEYFVKKNKKFENMFTAFCDSSRIDTYKYFYLVKWKNYPEEECTWESEKNCLSMSSIKTYKKLNGLPEECLKIRCSPSHFDSGKLNIQEMEELNVEEEEEEEQSYGFYPEFKTYNKVYGIVRCGELQRCTKFKNTSSVTVWTMQRGQQKFVLVEKNMTNLLNSPFCKTDPQFEKWQYDIQKKDRSYISSIIQHPNSVKMLDYFYSDKEKDKNTFIYSYLYEYFESNVRSRIIDKSMKLFDTKKMFADMLSILSLLHTYGIHHNISSNHIHIDKDTYKLSHFESFRFYTDEIEELDEDSLYYSNAYRQIDGFRELDEITFDIYALGVVLLESLTNRCIQSQDELTRKKEIKESISSLSEPQRTMVSTILNCQEYIHTKNVPMYRFSANSLLEHPWLCDDIDMNFVKVVFLVSYYSKPIDELVFYEEDDVAEKVIDRLTSLYFNSDRMSYQMLCMNDLNSGNCAVHYIESGELFVDCVKKYRGLKFVIVPILRAMYEDTENLAKAISFVYFPQEFGSVPIVIESAPMSDEHVCTTVIEQAFPVYHRQLHFVIMRLIPKFGRLEYVYNMCPNSVIDDNVKHVFAKYNHEEEFDISEPTPEYVMSIYAHPNLSEIQFLTSADDDANHVCEFIMQFEDLEFERTSRFAEFDNEHESSENVPENPIAKKRKVDIKEEPMHEY